MSSPPKQTMSPEETALHLSFMREALAMANLALTTSETPVGCIFVHNNTIIGRGMNATNRSYNGTRHAEFLGINDILTQTQTIQTTETVSAPDSERGEKEERKRYGVEILRECDLYVTVEPCIMCASLIRQMGIRRVFFGAANEKFGGNGGVLGIHERNGRVAHSHGDGGDGKERKGEMGMGMGMGEEGDYEVSGGWMREDAIVVLRRFYVQENERAPEPRSKKERVLKLEVEPMVEGAKMGEG